MSLIFTPDTWTSCRLLGVVSTVFACLAPSSFLLAAPPVTTFTEDTSIDAGDTTYDGHDLVIQGATLTVDGQHFFNTVHVSPGGMITHTAGREGFDLGVTGDLIIDAGGKISADIKGYGENLAPGAGVWGRAGALFKGSGGGYGGKGGDSTPVSSGGSIGGAGYGSIMAPMALGSGGGNWSVSYGAGGVGGGALRITVGGTLALDGEITTDGGDAAQNSGHCGGGGSGGSIYLIAGILSGVGQISADGGTVADSGCGGGSGGRILLDLEDDQHTGLLSVMGAAGYEAGADGSIVHLNRGRLTLNKPQIGNLGSHCGVEVWRFSALAGQQIRLKEVSSSNSSVVFDLWGPNGWRAFDSLAADSSLYSLTESGTYTVVARNTATGGSAIYSFQILETSVSGMSVNSAVSGSLAGSGQAQLFRVEIDDPTPARITFDDLSTGNTVEVYARLGSAPTRGDYDHRFDRSASGDQTILIPLATPGDWYILVFAETVRNPGAFNLKMETADIFVHKVSPGYHGTGADTVMTVWGGRVRLIHPGIA
ncbi:MAG: hypothetical protein GY703_22685 [Gammaproteobacteria bacterium]|nr:hypothetical protein [Gammaproteobacteria bacterium]